MGVGKTEALPSGGAGSPLVFRAMLAGDPAIRTRGATVGRLPVMS